MFTIMAKPFVLYFSLICVILLFTSITSCLGERAERFNECQLESLNALEPDYRIESEAGVTETWNSNHPELRCAGVTVMKHTIDPQGLHLPSYTNYPQLTMILQGKGVLGISVPGCSETFQEPAIARRRSRRRSSHHQSQSQQQQLQLEDSHQKIRHFKEGDILAIPPGLPYWTYNYGNEQLVAVSLLDTTSMSNQLDSNPRRFYIAGNPEEEHPETQRQGRQQQQQHQSSAGGRKRGQHQQEEEEEEEGSKNVLSGFDPRFLAQAFSVDEETIASIQSPDDRRKQIVRVKRGLSVISPEWEEEAEEEEECPQPRQQGRRGEREETREEEGEEEEEEPRSRERRERQPRRHSEGRRGREGEEGQEEEEPRSRERRERQPRRRGERQRGREGEEEEEEEESQQEGRGRESHEWERTTRRKHAKGEEGEEEEEEETRTRESRRRGGGRGPRQQEEEEEEEQGRQERPRGRGRRQEEEEQPTRGKRGSQQGGRGRRHGQQQEEEEEEEHSPQERRRHGWSHGISGNGLEETICTARLRENIANPSRADLYNPTAGRISSVNSLTLPILRWFQLSAEYVNLYKNGIYAPHWNINANSVIYAVRGRGWVQVVNCTGNSVFNGELRKGQLLVVPQNYVVAHQAGDEGFEFIAFKTNDLATTSPLKQVFRSIPAEVLANAFGIRLNQVSQLKYNGNQGPLVAPQSQSQDHNLVKVA